MKEKHCRIDINSYISDLVCKVDVQNGSSIATLSFQSLCKETITAIKFLAKGFNSFGDLVYVNGNDKFILIIQDIAIKQNEIAKNIKVTLPNADIRKLELVENQYCLSDGSVISYEGENWIEYDIEVFKSLDSAEKDQFEALKDINSKVICKPILIHSGWICLCGRYNDNNDLNCSNCHMQKEKVFEIVSDSGITKLVNDYKNKKAEQAIIKAKKLKENKMKIAVISVIGLIFLGLIINSVVLSHRKTFASESQMQTYMQGKWTYYTDYANNALFQIIIDDNQFGKVSKYDDSLEPKYTSDITWNPSRGTFSVGSKTYIVLSNGYIKDGKYEYKKGGYMTLYSSDSDNSSSSKYETAYTALKFSNIRISSNSYYTICTGTITNNGNKTYKFVQIKGSFKDSSGSVLDTDSTYAVGSEGLAPGESKTFRMSIDKNSKVKSCSVSIYHYN